MSTLLPKDPTQIAKDLVNEARAEEGLPKRYTPNAFYREFYDGCDICVGQGMSVSYYVRRCVIEGACPESKADGLRQHLSRRYRRRRKMILEGAQQEA